MRRILITLIAGVLLLGCAFGAFWYQDLRYSLPTPRPSALVQIPIGSRPALASYVREESPSKAELLHFFNPDCPCSRFNVEHLRYLISHYSNHVRFIAVLQVEKEDARKALESFRRLDLPMEAIVDTSGELAKRCGVYSTPQAIVLDKEGKLFYRGNYNRTRYCAEKSSEFVRIALDSLVRGAALPAFPQAATVSYGCELPSNLISKNTGQ